MTHPLERYDDERPAAGHLRHDGHELGVGRAEVAIVRVPGDLQTVIAAVPPRRRTEHVAKLGAAHAPKRKLKTEIINWLLSIGTVLGRWSDVLQDLQGHLPRYEKRK